MRDKSGIFMISEHEFYDFWDDQGQSPTIVDLKVYNHLWSSGTFSINVSIIWDFYGEIGNLL